MIDWTKAQSVELEWDDGHTPVSLLVAPSVVTTEVEGVSVGQKSNQSAESLKPHHVAGDTIVGPPKPPQPPPVKQFLRWYPNYHCLEREAVYRVDDALDDTLLDDIYTYTTRSAATSPTWGTYVTMDEIRAYWKSGDENPPINDHGVTTAPTNHNDDAQHRLALQVTADFLQHAILASSTSPTGSTKKYTRLSPIHSSPPTAAPQTAKPTPTNRALWTKGDCGDTNGDNSSSHSVHAAHGVAVWVLSSDVGSHVPYHMDYAELIRYETGVTVPPVLAGTIHCSRIVGDDNDTNDTCDAVMVGGDYMVHTTHLHEATHSPPNQLDTSGTETTPVVLDHYRTHGYKSILSTGAAWKDEPAVESETAGTPDDWIRIPYRFNRMICQSGYLPHLSTRIRSIEARATAQSCDASTPACPKRVVVGLNVFLHDVGPTVQQAPEHSEAFRQRVQRATPRNANGDEKGRKNGGLSLARLVANPQLSRRLVQAKREKSHRDFVAAQESLSQRIRDYLSAQVLPSHRPKSDILPSQMVPVHQLLAALAPPDDGTATVWPVTTSDVHVYLHRQWQRGILVCAWYCADCAEPNSADGGTIKEDDDGLTLVLPSTNHKGLIETKWWIGHCTVSQS